MSQIESYCYFQSMMIIANLCMLSIVITIYAITRIIEQIKLEKRMEKEWEKRINERYKNQSI